MFIVTTKYKGNMLDGDCRKITIVYLIFIPIWISIEHIKLGM